MDEYGHIAERDEYQSVLMVHVVKGVERIG